MSARSFGRATGVNDAAASGGQQAPSCVHRAKRAFKNSPLEYRHIIQNGSQISSQLCDFFFSPLKFCTMSSRVERDGLSDFTAHD